MAYSTNVRTVLKNINKDKMGTLFLEIVFIDSDTKKKIRRYINTKQKVHEDDIVKAKLKQVERTKLIRQIVEKKQVEVNDKLRALALEHGKLTPDIYDQSIVANIHARKTILELYDDFIKDVEDNFEPLTVKKHKTVKSLLKEYSEEKGKKKLFLNDINQGFYKEFTSFLKKTKKHAPQTVNKYQGCFKTFLKFLTEEMGLNQNEIHKKFKKESKKTEGGSKIVLLKEHIQKLVDWEPTNERYALVRDLFLFQVFTGIRYSDLVNVNKSYVKNNSLSFTMWKVEKNVTIPLHSFAMKILVKYNYSLGEQCKTLQNYNLDVKTVCQLAGLTDEIKSLKIKLSRKVSEDTPMWKLVSTHVGRTTFITNCLISGITPYIVMDYTGHEKIETLSGYMRIAGDMAKDAFTKFEEYFKFSI
jgi:site-specific recombinase XerD